MPAKKGSIDGYNLKQKFLDEARYIGNNFWKVLPVGSAINYNDKVDKDLIKHNPSRWAFHFIYGVAISSIVGISLVNYTFEGIETGAWTPKQIEQYKRVERVKTQIESEHKKEVDYRFNKIFEDRMLKDRRTLDFLDSLEIYNKYNLPFKFLEPSLKQKEEAIKQNELERSLK